RSTDFVSLSLPLGETRAQAALGAINRRLTRQVRCVATLLVVLVISANPARADFLDDANRMLSLGDNNSQFHLRISGLLDLEGYYLDQPAPGLIDTDDNLLFNPRLTIFVDARWSKYLYFFGQVRVDRGFDPSDEGAQIRLDEYFLRYKPFGNSR